MSSKKQIISKANQLRKPMFQLNATLHCSIKLVVAKQLKHCLPPLNNKVRVKHKRLTEMIRTEARKK